MKPSKRKKERLIELTSTRESKGVRRKLIKKNRRRKEAYFRGHPRVQRHEQSERGG